MLKKIFIVFIGLICLFPAAAFAAGWYTDTTNNTLVWPYRQQIMISGASVEATLTNFPVLIKITDTTNTVFSNAQSTGKDILFTSSDGITKLNHEIEWFATGATASMCAWVNIPTLTATTNTVIYMYYGSTAAPTQENKTAVWDSNYKGVWHLNNDPGPGAVGDIKDSTSNAYNGSAEATMFSTDEVFGQIGPAIHFDGSNDYISGMPKSLLQSTPECVEVWFKANDYTVRPLVWAGKQDTANVILVGTTVEAGTNVGTGYFVLCRFQATASENGATRLKVWSNASGNVKVGVYSDNASGSPEARLGYNDNQQAVVAGWNILTISPVNIVSGNYYWLGGILDTAGCFRRDATGTYRYKTATFSSFTFPDPAGTGFTSTSYVLSMAVFGSNSEFNLSTGFYNGSSSLSNYVSAFSGDASNTIPSTGNCLSAAYSMSDTADFHHMALSTTGTQGVFYIDGGLVSSDSSAVIDKTTNWIAGTFFGGSGSGPSCFAGIMDEIRISNSTRAPEWIKTEYKNQGSPSSFCTFSAQEYRPSATLISKYIDDPRKNMRAYLPRHNALLKSGLLW